MALFRTPTKDWDYEIVREGEDRVLRIHCETYTKIPSLEDDPLAMSKAVEILTKAKDTTKILFYQKRDYEYEMEQTLILAEIARVYAELAQKKSQLSLFDIGRFAQYRSWYVLRQDKINNIIFFQIKQDPLGAYVALKRLIREEKILKDTITDETLLKYEEKYIAILSFIKHKLENTRLIKSVLSELEGYKIGDRNLYRNIFRPIIKPDFMYTKLQSQYPEDSEILDTYMVGETEVNIFKTANQVQYLYHMMPPEFRLTEEQYELLDTARSIMAEHKPTRSEFIDPERMREVFFNVGTDMLTELSTTKGYKLKKKELEELARILLRYTVGFGLIEVLMEDEKIQDVTVNSPLGRLPIFVVHEEFSDCTTNIIPMRTEAESWATKLRLVSGKPLDEANPILDTELDFPSARARVSAVGPPLDPTGLAFSFRRHRNKPWTLPLFIHAKMLNSIAAGILSFLIDGTKTMLVAGTRSSGKTSLLGSLMVEIMRRYRIITIEDTIELPTAQIRRLGYNLLSMKVASELATIKEAGIGATEGIRATLRLGDSSLIVGEVRSTEAIALYEAMRIGAAANVVAGTIHADSPYGVFDRVVNDIGVPRTSFKATDIIITATPVRSPDGLHRWRRVTGITEVRKDWLEDPMRENAFIDLLKYNSKNDELEPSADLINGDSEILKSIAGNVKQWAGKWDAVWDNILLRAKIKQAQVDYALKANNLDLLEAPFSIACNDQFHLVSDVVLRETGTLDSKMIFDLWDRWCRKEVRKRAIK
ncbi:type II/IV secretion system ATPase subunit [Candidatus Woesearchaeota archaeon]|nr:type II/IV secretion system ATPase subunit [Candidatus Woesearchaeota archaeon]